MDARRSFSGFPIVASATKQWHAAHLLVENMASGMKVSHYMKFPKQQNDTKLEARLIFFLVSTSPEEFPKSPTYLGHGDTSKMSKPLNWNSEHSLVPREGTSLGLEGYPRTGSAKDSVLVRYAICSPELPVTITPFRPR